MGFETVKTLTMSPGVTVDIQVNADEPETSIDRYAVDTICTGKSGTDAFYVPPHWHKHHSEHFTVLEGRVAVTIDGVKHVIRAGDPVLFVPARTVHSIQGFKGERLVVRERADPAGDYKAVFFSDVFSTGSFGTLADVPHMLRAFYDGDTYLALPLYFRFFDEVFMTIAGGLAHLIAPKRVKTL
ncbi:hypothetical protein JX265_011422 [Neoarthrinium moseri]|uniref:Cupin type-2 domain-containing protein n=1 Tax=Neoarthrinium moseri TaxID=1658444 RepID=A0A9P9WCM9_9PEZI|nr:uncharacterized protein JN550_000941 [Neoarthrinium moseri]KAI1856781.1 hypothetical protein JX265_011422 [Neoarthrinium moseri]KAI1876869.1 hypothetical protein JN550_000941 [Neoarthrinium moseri]